MISKACGRVVSLPKICSSLTTFLALLTEAGQFPFELSRKLVHERLVAEQNIPQPVQHALFARARDGLLIEARGDLPGR